MLARVLHALTLCLLFGSVTLPSSEYAQTLWLWHPDYGVEHGFVPATLGIAKSVTSPSQQILGNLPRAGTVGEVAVEQKVISLGEQVPLPTFPDGTQATESEIFWTVQLWQATFASAMEELDKINDANLTFSGRTFTGAEIHWGRSSSPMDTKILVNVVAVRPHDNRRSNR
jgi:hypothetical protein